MITTYQSTNYDMDFENEVEPMTDRWYSSHGIYDMDS